MRFYHLQSLQFFKYFLQLLPNILFFFTLAAVIRLTRSKYFFWWLQKFSLTPRTVKLQNLGFPILPFEVWIFLIGIDLILNLLISILVKLITAALILTLILPICMLALLFLVLILVFYFVLSAVAGTWLSTSPEQKQQKSKYANAAKRECSNTRVLENTGVFFIFVFRNFCSKKLFCISRRVGRERDKTAVLRRRGGGTVPPPLETQSHSLMKW